MVANLRAGSQLQTLGVLRRYIHLSGKPPRLEKLSELRNMTYAAVRHHMIYLERNGYIVRIGKSWRTVGITAKGEAA